MLSTTIRGIVLTFFVLLPGLSLAQGQGHAYSHCHDIKFEGEYPEIPCPEGTHKDEIAAVLCKVAFAEGNEANDTIECLQKGLCTLNAHIARGDAWVAYATGVIDWDEYQSTLAYINQVFHQCNIDAEEENGELSAETLAAYHACMAGACVPNAVFSGPEREMRDDQLRLAFLLKKERLNEELAGLEEMAAAQAKVLALAAQGQPGEHNPLFNCDQLPSLQDIVNSVVEDYDCPGLQELDLDCVQDLVDKHADDYDAANSTLCDSLRQSGIDYNNRIRDAKAALQSQIAACNGDPNCVATAQAAYDMAVAFAVQTKSDEYDAAQDEFDATVAPILTALNEGIGDCCVDTITAFQVPLL